jgi:hypothetical protein
MKSLAVVVALWIALLPARTASAGSPRIAARPLIPLGAPKATMDAWLAARDPSRVTLYGADADPADVAWGILASEPALARLRWSANASAWVAERVWSFASHVHSVEKEEAQFAIRPALYPIGPGTWGVALVQTVVEMYSGGGATFEIADFVSLSETDASVTTVLRDVPLSCSRMVRACFSEDDYRRLAVNCHDLYDGFLTLSYATVAPPDRYEWTAVWHERDQGQGLPRSQASSTEQRLKLSQGTADVASGFKSGSFCGGGLMGER